MPSFLLDFLLIIPNYPQQKFNLTRGDSSIRCGQGETIPVRAVILSYTHQQYWKKRASCVHINAKLSNNLHFCFCSILLFFFNYQKVGLFCINTKSLFSFVQKCVQKVQASMFCEGMNLKNTHPLKTFYVWEDLPDFFC